MYSETIKSQLEIGLIVPIRPEEKKVRALQSRYPGRAGQLANQNWNEGVRLAPYQVDASKSESDHNSSTSVI